VEEDQRLGSQDLALTEGLSPPEKGPVRVAIESRSDSIQGFTYDGLAAQSMRISSTLAQKAVYKPEQVGNFFDATVLAHPRYGEYARNILNRFNELQGLVLSLNGGS
jgi:hypothetical protein